MIGDVLQPTHLLLILLVALIVLGPKRLPEAGKSLGKGLRDFKDAISGYSPEHLLDSDHTIQAATPEIVHEEPPPTEDTAQSSPAGEFSSTKTGAS